MRPCSAVFLIRLLHKISPRWCEEWSKLVEQLRIGGQGTRSQHKVVFFLHETIVSHEKKKRLNAGHMLMFMCYIQTDILTISPVQWRSQKEVQEGRSGPRRLQPLHDTCWWYGSKEVKCSRLSSESLPELSNTNLPDSPPVYQNCPNVSPHRITLFIHCEVSAIRNSFSKREDRCL